MENTERVIFMKCPYCNQEMILGNLRAPSDHAVYWLPTGANLERLVVTKSEIEKKGGYVLDHIPKIGFVAKKRPDSYYCQECQIFITKKAD